ncbi:MAG: protein kinase [Myxococcales bacterium]|nr:protein kinase [Myxococcales bacterium]MCB9534446.1 protein kinase [Myxococcales bacterium]
MRLHEVYELQRWIGGGRQAEVWRGVHTPTGAGVALKVLHDAAGAGDLVALRAEARSLARLTHPNVVGVLDVGRLSGPDGPETARLGGRTCFAMELGEQTLVPALGSASWDLVLGCAHDLLAGLAHVGARGLVHGDIKPSNVLLMSSAAGAVAALSDFGVVGVTAGGTSRGSTPGFAPPDLATRPLAPDVDLYSLGVTLGQLVAGGAIPDPALERGAWRAAVAARLDAVGAPAAMLAWLERLVLPAADARWQHAADARGALVDLAGERPARLVRPACALGDDATDLPTEAVLMPLVAHRFAAASPSETTDTHTPPRELETWRESVVRHASVSATPPAVAQPRPLALLGAGARLVHARRSTLFGREDVQARLWSAFAEVASTRLARVVAVRGVDGSGRRRVADWIAEAADEHAGAIAVRVPEAGDLAARLCGAIAGVWWRLPLDGATANDVERLLTRGPEDGFRDDAERLAAFVAWLAGMAAYRPVVVVCDGRETTLRLAGRLAGLARPVLLVGAWAGAPLDTVDEDLALERVADPAVAAMVRATLGVSARVAESVSERSAGLPGLAKWIVSDWVATSRLRPTADGLAPPDGATSVLPVAATVREAARVEAWESAWDVRTRRAIRLAAVWGERLDDARFAVALRLAGAEWPAVALDALGTADAVTGPTEGWRLRSPALAAAWLAAMGAAESRELHAACAGALAGVTRPSDLVRRARHHAASGAKASARRDLLRLLDAGVGASEAEAGLAVARALGGRGALEAVLRARLCYALGDGDGTLAALDAVDWASAGVRAAAAAHDVRALVALSRGQVDRAGAELEAMLALPGLRGLPAFSARVARGRWLIVSRRAEEAVAVLADALAHAPRGVGPRARLVATVLLCHAGLHSGALAVARDAAASAAAQASRHGTSFLQAQILSDLAEIDAREGRWEQALASWERALEMTGERFPALAYQACNVAWALVRLGRRSDAAGRVEETLVRFAPTDTSLARLHTLALRVATAADPADPLRWDAAVAELDAAMAMTPAGGHDEAGDAAEYALAVWQADGDAVRAGVALGLALRWWDRLRRPARAAALARES